MKKIYLNLYIFLSILFSANGIMAQYTFDFTSGSVLVDHGIRTLESDVDVPSSVNKLTIDIDITHTWVHDLEMTLINPDGDRLTVFKNLGTDDCFGCGGDDLLIQFSDSSPVDYTELNQSCGDLPAYSGDSKAMTSLDAFLSGSLNGKWYVEIKDHWPFEKGFANEIKLTFGEYEEPQCTAVSYPVNGEIQVPVNTLISWEERALATGYFLSIGTEPDLTDFLEKTDVGDTTIFDPGLLECGQTYFVSVVPYNAYGEAQGCSSDSFSTEFVESGNSGDVSVCLGEQTILTGQGGLNYQWVPDTFLDDNTSSSPTCTPEHDITYSIIVYNENACADTSYLTVTVEEIMINVDSVYHVRTDLPGFILISDDDLNGDYTYSWTGPNGFTATTQDIYGLDIGCYTLQVTDPSRGCVAEITVCVDDLTYVPGLINPDKIIVYPNPASDILFVDFTVSHQKACKIIISSMSGEKVMVFNRENFQEKLSINTEKLEAGPWLLQFITADKISNHLIELIK